MARARVAYAYHGTTEKAAKAILKSGFHVSQNAYDWLGDGVYFFQDAPMRAREWAERLHGGAAVVLEARIRLMNCIDLLDIGWWEFLRESYESFFSDMKKEGLSLPHQTIRMRRLDQQVLNYAVETYQKNGGIVRSIRSVFIEGKPAYPESGLYDRSHVQIAVRDQSMIESLRVMK